MEGIAMKHYSKEFKEEALKLSDEIGVKKAAQQLGVAYYTLADWRSISAYYAGVTDCHRIEADKERRNCSCAAYGARTVSAFAG